jgi:hypothetical protein
VAGEATSRIYADAHLLDFNEPVSDHFCDPGRGCTFRPLADWRADQLNLDGREVLEVQLGPLRPLLDEAARRLGSETNARAKFKLLGTLCSDQLGGKAAMRDVGRTEASLGEIKRQLRSNVVPLHKLLEANNGVCRHRSLLFKVLCDELCQQPEHATLKCRLVRGAYQHDADSGGGHAWNVVLLDGKPQLCDVMHDPGTLYDIDSTKADHYKRLTLVGTGGLGADSVPTPRELAAQPGVIRLNELTIGRQLGKGGFGVVHAAKWKHEDVAVKQIKLELIAPGDQRLRAQKEFQAELELLLSIPNRHIVQCYGGSCENEFLIVTELMERGSLYDCLSNHREEFAWLRLGKKVLLDAAKGLRYLHTRSPPLTHFDIKPLNVLVSSDNTGKLADVGLTKKMEHSVTRPQGHTPMYAAPEILNRQGANEKSDIYSFGIMVWEVYTGRQPSQFDCCDVDASWPVAPLLRGGGATGHGGALAHKKERRPSALQLEDELNK